MKMEFMVMNETKSRATAKNKNKVPKDVQHRFELHTSANESPLLVQRKYPRDSRA